MVVKLYKMYMYVNIVFSLSNGCKSCETLVHDKEGNVDTHVYQGLLSKGFRIHDILHSRQAL